MEDSILQHTCFFGGKFFLVGLFPRIQNKFIVANDEVSILNPHRSFVLMTTLT